MATLRSTTTGSSPRPASKTNSIFRSVDPATNHGVLSATGPAGLVIANSTVNSAGGGQIIANAPGAHVELNNAILQGGTLRTFGSGATIETAVPSRNNVLDGGINAVSNKGHVVVNDRTALELRGTIKNANLIEVDGGANQTDLRIGATAPSSPTRATSSSRTRSTTVSSASPAARSSPIRTTRFRAPAPSAT